MTVKQSNQLRRNAIRVSQSFDFMSTSQPLHQKDSPAKPQPRQSTRQGKSMSSIAWPQNSIRPCLVRIHCTKVFYVYQVCFHLMLTSLTKKIIQSFTVLGWFKFVKLLQFIEQVWGYPYQFFLDFPTNTLLFHSIRLSILSKIPTYYF